MGKRMFWMSVTVGAVMGGLTSLMNRDVRKYVKESANKIGNTTTYYVNHPNEAIQNIKKTIAVVEQKLEENSGSAYNALNQIESTVNKFTK